MRMKWLVLCMVLVAGVLQAASIDKLEKALKNLRTQTPNVERLGALFAARVHAPNAEVQAMVLQACAAGLLYIGQQDTYHKMVRPLMPSVEDFEASLMVDCKRCTGAGQLESPCETCKGSGLCVNRKCSNGVTTSEGFDGKREDRRCVICSGTGQCTACKGAGKLTRKCTTCGGSGKTLSASTALAQCRAGVEKALAGCEAAREL